MKDIFIPCLNNKKKKEEESIYEQERKEECHSKIGQTPEYCSPVMMQDSVWPTQLNAAAISEMGFLSGHLLPVLILVPCVRVIQRLNNGSLKSR